MRKFTKQAMVLGLSMSLLMAGCMTAYAEEGSGTSSGAETVTGDSSTGEANKTTFKITAPSNNHQYEIYQIFTGDYSGGKLTNEKWGANGTGEEGTAVDEDTLNALKDVSGDGKTYTEKINVINRYVKSSSAAVETITNGSSYDAVPGYYLIKDITDTKNALYVVQVVGTDFTIKPKTDETSFEKKIKDTNDTTGDTSDWQDSADYDIGDQVPFKLEGTVTSNYDDYETYYFGFHDKEENGLTFNKDSVKVSVGENELSKDDYDLVTAPKDGCTFEVVFRNLKTLVDSEGNALVHAGSKITVEYTSELNDNAVLGNQGNVNGAKLEFSKKTDNDQNGTTETPWDNVIVFTYKVVVDKYANSVDGEKLAGAEFTLEKVLKDGTKETVKVVKSGDGTSFTFKGLDDGKYILTETKTPDGYNTIDPITFTVNADHTTTWDGGESNRTDILTDLTGTATTGDITFTANTDKSELATKVVNKQGVTLPSTGGIGTTIFYVIGGIMAAGAAILLIAKKRMEVEK